MDRETALQSAFGVPHMTAAAYAACQRAALCRAEELRRQAWDEAFAGLWRALRRSPRRHARTVHGAAA